MHRATFQALRNGYSRVGFPTAKVHRVQFRYAVGNTWELSYIESLCNHTLSFIVAFTNRVILQHYTFQHFFNVCWLTDKALSLWRRKMLKLSTLLPPPTGERERRTINLYDLARVAKTRCGESSAEIAP